VLPEVWNVMAWGAVPAAVRFSTLAIVLRRTVPMGELTPLLVTLALAQTS